MATVARPPSKPSVYSAVDCATDQTVGASDASSRRRYRCAVCQAPVVLRAGGQRANHFAHAAGQADPDCTAYFGGHFIFTGRRTPSRGPRDAGGSVDSTRLYFDETLSGPELGLWLPSAAANDTWTGTVEVRATGTTKRLSMAHLLSGCMVTFPLVDGQWNVSVGGDVSDDYRSRLDVGPGSLESGLNLFDAMQSPSPRLGPSAPVRLGEAVWVVTRSASFGSVPKGGSIVCEERAPVGGWHVFFVQLPTDASPTLAATITEWLQRALRFKQARVWIEAPWASAMTPRGVPVLPLQTHGVELRADQAVDLQIRDSESGATMFEALGCLGTVWESPVEGRFTIFANDLAFLTFELRHDLVPPLPALGAEIDGEFAGDVFALQTRIDGLRARGVQKASVRLLWGSAAVGQLLQVDGRQISLSADSRFVDIPMVPGTDLRADRLGAVCWPALEPSRRSAFGYLRGLESLRERARWLLSVSQASTVGEIQMPQISDLLAADTDFGQLRNVAWPIELAAHVQALARDLQDYS